MVTVEVSAKLTMDDLIAAVEQLPAQELTEFVRRIIAIQARRDVPLLVDEEEEALLEAIKGQRLSHNAQARLNMLRDKSRAGRLAPEDQAELLKFVQQVESQDLTRIEALVALARKRGVTISVLMNELGIETPGA